jgi:hypothetical protein
VKEIKELIEGDAILQASMHKTVQFLSQAFIDGADRRGANLDYLPRKVNDDCLTDRVMVRF